MLNAAVTPAPPFDTPWPSGQGWGPIRSCRGTTMKRGKRAGPRVQGKWSA